MEAMTQDIDSKDGHDAEGLEMGDEGEAADFYQRRDELRPGQVYRTCVGNIVRLARHLPGDGTDWLVETWDDGWRGEDDRIHPSELSERLPDPASTTAPPRPR